MSLKMICNWAIKNLDPCDVLKKVNLKSFDDFLIFINLKLMHKCLHN